MFCKTAFTLLQILVLTLKEPIFYEDILTTRISTIAIPILTTNKLTLKWIVEKFTKIIRMDFFVAHKREYGITTINCKIK